MVVDQIDVLPVHNRLSVLLSVNHHVFVEKPVHSDVLERHFTLNEFQMFLKIRPKRFADPPTADIHTPLRV